MLRLAKIVNALEMAKRKIKHILINLEAAERENGEDYSDEKYELNEELYDIDEALYILKEYE